MSNTKRAAINAAKSRVRKELRRELRDPFEMAHAMHMVSLFIRTPRTPLGALRYVTQNIERIKADAAAHHAAMRAAQHARQKRELARVARRRIVVPPSADVFALWNR